MQYLQIGILASQEFITVIYFKIFILIRMTVGNPSVKVSIIMLVIFLSIQKTT